jgi:O-acetyl-ADP-ribose deacetylase (regulator of RNase III)
MSTLDHSDLILNDVRVSIVVNRIEWLVLAGGFDAVVSSDDAQLSMGGGVSGAILSAAGGTVTEESKRLSPLKVGDVAVTSAGQLPTKYILHAVTVDWAEGSTGRAERFSTMRTPRGDSARHARTCHRRRPVLVRPFGTVDRQCAGGTCP